MMHDGPVICPFFPSWRSLRIVTTAPSSPRMTQVTQKKECVDLFLSLNLVISPIFWGVATCGAAERIGACPR